MFYPQKLSVVGVSGNRQDQEGNGRNWPSSRREKKEPPSKTEGWGTRAHGPILATLDLNIPRAFLVPSGG